MSLFLPPEGEVLICLGRTILSCVGNGLKIVDFRSSYIDISYTKMILGSIPTFWVTRVLVDERFSKTFFNKMAFPAVLCSKLVVPTIHMMYLNDPQTKPEFLVLLGFWSTNTF